ncbi:glycoside hydrolase family 76 protein [Pseudochryseolinea flava]|uniref:Glycosyltransferase n=1 Tax=Pseudochryseolinea flava TaxID=2059302 RepID=A0A364Y0L4_9BACT|nr:glycoside hydrolase family 76 protein [Pseudochryseolinea flava]RAW00195.1 glycosyltransferase [Pseudochryseolinea flava]
MIRLLAFLTLFVFSCSSCKAPEDDQLIDPDDNGPSQPELSYKEKAKEVYDLIQTKYKTGDLYKENYPAQGDDIVSYLWPYVGMLRAGNLLYELGYPQDIHTKIFDALEKYYVSRTELPGYQAEPVTNGTRDIFYDDNCIVAMELINAYKLTKKQVYLDRVIAITEFIMSGEDDRLGGGMYWLESVSRNCNDGVNCIKAANTTAYGAYVGAEMYKLTSANKYLTYAKRLYAWNYNNLRDTDNLYWNDKHITSGQINATKWTYNAAMMILAGISLHEITKEQSYLDQAIATARSSYSKFTKVVNDQLFYPSNDPWFNVELMKAFVELSKYDDTSKTYVQTFIRNADYAWSKARTKEGQFYEDWSGRSQGRYYWLLHQACMIEAYGLAALYLK